MKNIIFFLGLLASTTLVCAQETYNIEGTVKSMPATKKVTVNLFFTNEDMKFIRDTCDVVNGHFSFKGLVRIPHSAFLSMTDDGESFIKGFPAFKPYRPNIPDMVQIPLFLEKGNITAVLDHAHQDDAIITGTMNNDAYQEFRPIKNKYKKMEAELLEKAKSSGKIQFENNVTALAAMNKERKKELGAVIKKNPSALADVEMLRQYFLPTEDLASAKLYYSYLSPELKNSAKGIKYLDAITKASVVEKGAMAPDFSLPDTAGNIQTLSKYKGKYVLLDFWASWCVPCRKETPNLIKAYNTYKGKNFEIVSISLDGGKDSNRKQWLDAINQDKMSWLQLSDLTGFLSKVEQLYVVNSIPMNYLIDPSGKIIGKNLFGEELQKELHKYL